MPLRGADGRGQRLRIHHGRRLETEHGLHDELTGVRHHPPAAPRECRTGCRSAHAPPVRCLDSRVWIAACQEAFAGKRLGRANPRIVNYHCIVMARLEASERKVPIGKCVGIPILIFYECAKSLTTYEPWAQSRIIRHHPHLYRSKVSGLSGLPRSRRRRSHRRHLRPVEVKYSEPCKIVFRGYVGTAIWIASFAFFFV